MLAHQISDSGVTIHNLILIVGYARYCVAIRQHLGNFSISFFFSLIKAVTLVAERIDKWIFFAFI